MLEWVLHAPGTIVEFVTSISEAISELAWGHTWDHTWDHNWDRTCIVVAV